MIVHARGPRQHPARDHRFHALRVGQVVRETAEASSFVLDVPPELHDAFAYDAGQFCTFRVPIDGQVHLRCYSMSSSPDVGDPFQVAVKRVPGGVVSNWLNDHVVAGDTLDVGCPAGVFTLPAAAGAGDLVAFGAGSGITPLLAIVKSVLATSARPVRLLYANRDRSSIMFDTELAQLVERHPDRCCVVHHLDDDSGLVQADAVRALLDGCADPDLYVCGPTPFMDLVEEVALACGVPTERIHVERFTSAELAPGLEVVDGGEVACEVTIELDGRTDTTVHHPGATILQTARQLGMAPPFSCEAGNCATCMARLREGEVAMHVNNALTDQEVAEGWVLTCQAVPASAAVHVVYGFEES